MLKNNVAKYNYSPKIDSTPFSGNIPFLNQTKNIYFYILKHQHDVRYVRGKRLKKSELERTIEVNYRDGKIWKCKCELIEVKISDKTGYIETCVCENILNDVIHSKLNSKLENVLNEIPKNYLVNKHTDLL
jgi:hypothetical protein